MRVYRLRPRDVPGLLVGAHEGRGLGVDDRADARRCEGVTEGRERETDMDAEEKAPGGAAPVSINDRCEAAAAHLAETGAFQKSEAKLVLAMGAQLALEALEDEVERRFHGDLAFALLDVVTWMKREHTALVPE